jgi:cellobiose phosphorylase
LSEASRLCLGEVTTPVKFRGVEYQIEVKNPSGICKGVKKVTVDGKAVAGNVVPFEAGKKVVKVEITLEA